MLNALTHGKVEEIIRLAERARSDPGGRADDPRRGRPGDRSAGGGVRPAPPLAPHPEPDWADALARYLADLSDAALAELEMLRRLGGEVAAQEPHPEGPSGRAPARPADLAADPDHAARLRAALERLDVPPAG